MKKFAVGILLFFFCFSVHAAESKFNVAEEQVHTKDHISLSLKSSEDQIELIYDQNIFEVLDTKNFQKDLAVKKENHTFYLEQPSNIQIDLAVKENATKGKTTIIAKYNDESISKEIEILGENTFPLALIYGVIAIAFVIFGFIYFMKHKSKIEQQEIIALGLTAFFTIAFLVLSIMNLDFASFNSKKNETQYTITVDKDEEEQTEEEEEEKPEEPESEQDPEKTATPVNVIYSAVLNSYQTDTKVVEKDGEVLITFSINISPYMDVEYVVINNQTYPVWKNQGNYQVKVQSSSQYGEKNFMISKVILKNGKQIQVENKQVQVYVLKNAPKIQNIHVDDKNTIPILSFEVADPDQTFVSGKVIMSSITDSPLQISLYQTIANPTLKNSGDILNTTISKAGVNSFEVPKLKEGMSYDLVIQLDYSLDEKKIDQKYSYEQEESLTATFEREYNFKLADAKITTPVTQESPLNFLFKNDAYAYKDFEKIEIDGKIYTLEKDPNTLVYTVKEPIDKCSEKGLCKISITALLVTTENNEEKKIPCHEEIEYLYLKEAPTIKNFTPQYHSSSITGTYQIEDVDQTIQKGLLIMEGTSGKETLELDLMDLTTDSFTKAFHLQKSGDYQVTLQVFYDLGDGKLLTKEYKSTETIHQDVEANITSVQVLEGKVERGQTATLSLVINSNTSETLQQVTIDSVEYPVTFKNGAYEVQNVKVPLDGEGLTRTISITKLKYSNDVSIDYPVTLDLLKLKPSLESLTLEVVDGKIVGTVAYQDDEDAMIGAKYKIDGETIELSKEEVQTKKFTDSKNRMENTYTVQFILRYDLGNGEGPEDVTISNNVTVPLAAEITEATISEFIEKGADIVVTYTIKDNTLDPVTKIKVNEVEYPVTPGENDTYTITIHDASGTSGLKTFTASEIIYSDEKKATMNNEVTTTVLKSNPEIGELTAEYDDSSNTLTGDITISDSEETITKGLLTITGPNFKETKEISAEDLRASHFTTEVDLTYMGEYQLSLVIVYNLGDQDISSEPKETTVSVDLKVSDVQIEAPQFVEKDQPIELIYTIEDNQFTKDLKITQITINGTKKTASYDAETGKYKITLDGVSEKGLQTYTTSALTYQTIEEDIDLSTLDKNTEVYVLKTKPVVQEPTYTETEAHIEASDADKAITKIEITFEGLEDPFTKKTIDITSKTASISELTNGLYNVTVTTEYDIDGEENDFEGTKKTETQTYENVRIVTNYHAEIQNLTLQNITEEQVTLEFEIKNDTGIDITDVKVVAKDGSEYETTFNALTDKYTATINNPKEKKELTIGKVTFKTNVTKEVDQTEYVLINKTKPSISMETQIEERKVKATITKTDFDETIDASTYYAVLKNMETSEEEKILIQSESVQFTTILDGGTEYKVEVRATYNPVDGKSHENEVLTTSEKLTIDPEITYLRTYMITSYAHPDSNDFTIHYEFSSNLKLKNVMQTIKVKTTEYEGGLYEQVGGIGDEGIDYNLRCPDSVVQTEGNYKTDCTISYKVPKKSSVIKVKALSYTFNDKTNNEVKTTETPGAEENTIDVLKRGPNPTYHVKNYYDEENRKIELNISFDDVSMLEAYDGQGANAYFRISYGSLITKYIQVEDFKAKTTYTWTLENIPKVSSGIRLTLQGRYNPYHGIINPETEKTEEITLISPIHFFPTTEKLMINNIELVDGSGRDFSDKITEGDPVKLSFEFDGEVSFVPTEVMLTLDEQAEEKYTLVPNDKGGYVTSEQIKNLTKGQHTLKIVKLANKNNEYPVKENNTISFAITDILQVRTAEKTPLIKEIPKEKQEYPLDVLDPLDYSEEKKIKQEPPLANEEETEEELLP